MGSMHIETSNSIAREGGKRLKERDRTSALVMGIIGASLGLCIAAVSLYTTFSYSEFESNGTIMGGIISTALLFACYGLALPKALQLKDDPRWSGGWIIGLAVVGIFINLVCIIPGVALLIAGVMGLTSKE